MIPSIINLLYEKGYAPPRRCSRQSEADEESLLYREEREEIRALAYYNSLQRNVGAGGETQRVYGIKPRNAEQAFAIHAALKPEIKLVSMQGVAGTGKTLIALAAALEQKRDFKQIYLARPIVPLSNKDIGYLPGDIKSKAQSIHGAPVGQPEVHSEPVQRIG